MIFDTRIHGIPCQCKVIHFAKAVPAVMHGPGMAPPEPEELEYEILDRRGRRAPWLEKYITPTVDQRIAEEHSVMRMAEYYGH